MKLTDIRLATGVAAIWSPNFVVIHVKIESFPPLIFSALRFVLAAFPLILFIPKPEKSWAIILKIGLVLGVRTLMGYIPRLGAVRGDPWRRVIGLHRRYADFVHR